MATVIGLNGFGRIGRYLLRLIANDAELDLAVVNARASNSDLAYLFKYDSVHGTFRGSVEPNDVGFLVNGKQVRVTRNNLNEWQWKDYGVQIAVESTGKLKDREMLAQHLACGAQKTIISAPGKDVDVTVVMGVNQNEYDPKLHSVISAGSCTTNCLAPVAKTLSDAFGIKHALMTTIHSYTMSQRIVDGSHKDLRRGRAAAVSMLPTTTGAAKTLSLIIPELKGKIDGMAVRVPTPNVSLVDLTCELEKDTSVEEINAVLKKASETNLLYHMGYTNEPLVSCDFLGSTFAGVVDAECTAVIDKRMAKIITWYDNEAGFTNQLVRLLRLVAGKL